MAQPLIGELAEQGPVDVVCLPQLADLYAAMPGVRSVIQPPFQRGQLQWSLRRAIAQDLRTKNYSLAVICPNSWKSALLPWMAGIPHRRGLRGEARWILLNDVRISSSQSQPEAYASLAPDPTRCRDRLPALHATPLPDDHPLAWPRTKSPRLILAPGAEFGPAKQWPATHWSRLAEDWLASDAAVMVLGGPKDVSIEADIVAGLSNDHRPRLLRRAGQTRLAEALALLAEADAVVSNDSGLMHVAAALGRPTLGLYGSSDPRRTPVQGRKAAHLWLQLDCSPCFARDCPLGTRACLTGLSPVMVQGALERLRQNAGS